MQDCKPASTSMDANTKLHATTSPQTPEEKEEMRKVSYQEAVGSLLHACQISRPDIAYSVSAVSRYNKNHRKIHWSAVKRIFRYLKGTINYRLEYNRDAYKDIEGFNDADWGNKMTDRKSVTGSCFRFQGALISWFSKKQQTVALSTTEAEYMTMSFSCQEALWLKQLAAELDLLSISRPITLYCDIVITKTLYV